MKKKLPLSTALLATALLTGCFGQVETHEHTFNLESYEHNETSHWHKATCEHTDLVKDLASHNYGSDNVCDDCGYVKPIEEQPHEHTFASEWSKDETNHWHSATCEHTELVSGLSAHNFGDDDVCDDCGYTKPAPAHEHTFKAEYSFDETNHWYEATCEHHDLTQGLEAHNFGDDNVCDDCGYTKPAPFIPHEHTFANTWSNDETSHWHAATCEHTDLTKDLALHNFGDDNVCDDCGYAKPAPAHEHTFATEWSKDETNHWHASTCEHTGLSKDLSAHEYDDDNICDVCGYEYIEKYYSVIWKNYDGEILEVDYQVKEGTTPTCETTPTKDDGGHVFNFTGWSPEVGPITKNMVFTANFEQDMSQKLVIFKDDLGNELNRQLVLVGEEPDMTQFTYKGIIENNKVKVLTGWDKPLGKIYEDTTFVGSYETYNKTLTAGEINEVLSTASLGTNSAYDIYGYKNNALIHIEHISIANKKYRSVYEYFDSENIDEVYMDENYRYHYRVRDGVERAMINEYEETPLFDWDIQYDMSSFKTDADYTFDLETGLFISNGSQRKVFLNMKDGQINYIKSILNYDMDTEGNATTYEELHNLKIGGVEPFDIPEHDYEGVEKYKVTFVDLSLQVVNEQFVYEGALPDFSKANVPERIETEDRIFEFKGWENIVEPVYEDVTFAAPYYVYKKTYTKDEIEVMLTAEAYGNNVSFDYSYGTETAISWTNHIALSNGVYKEYGDPDENYTYFETYADSNYLYDLYVECGQVEMCRKRETPFSPESRVDSYLDGFVIDANYVYDEDLDLYVSENSYKTVWLKFKDGKVCFLKYEFKQILGSFDTLEITGVGDVPSITIPSYDWQTDEEPEHEHTFETKWTSNEENHWHAATCIHSDVTANFGPHIFGDDNVCDTCGYVKVVHIHSFSTEWSMDENKHWHPATCGHDDVTSFGNHTYGDDNICTVCGFKKIEKHTITYENWPEGIENPNPTEFIRTDVITLDGSTILEKEGFSNVKFMVDGNEVTTLTGIDKDVTVTVAYDASVTKMTINPDNDRDESFDINVSYWTKPSDLIGEFSRSGHDFVYWVDSEGNKVNIDERWENLDSTFTLTAKWKFIAIDKYISNLEEYKSSLVVEAAKGVGENPIFASLVDELDRMMKTARNELLLKEYTKTEADTIVEKHEKLLNNAAVSKIMPVLISQLMNIYSKKMQEIGGDPIKADLVTAYYTSHMTFGGPEAKMKDVIISYQSAVLGFNEF